MRDYKERLWTQRLRKGYSRKQLGKMIGIAAHNERSEGFGVAAQGLGNAENKMSVEAMKKLRDIRITQEAWDKFWWADLPQFILMAGTLVTIGGILLFTWVSLTAFIVQGSGLYDYGFASRSHAGEYYIFYMVRTAPELLIHAAYPFIALGAYYVFVALLRPNK